MTRPFELGFREALMFSSGSSVIAAIERAGSLHRNSEKTQECHEKHAQAFGQCQKKGHITLFELEFTGTHLLLRMTTWKTYIRGR